MNQGAEPTKCPACGMKPLDGEGTMFRVFYCGSTLWVASGVVQRSTICRDEEIEKLRSLIRECDEQLEDGARLGIAAGYGLGEKIQRYAQRDY
jgi:hypothetical protein